ncbi:hypothetical protein [Formosa sp. A9]|uniref:hypothetical protein n=1 Tax=Formosa sp. A9 TaxID=3442641 RepID=UPI003EB88706
MASDEILFKVAADLSGLKDDLQDLSGYWEKHNKEIAKGEKAMNDYTTNTVKDYEKVNQALKKNTKQLTEEAKAAVILEKQIQSLNEANKQSFNDEQLKEFNSSLSLIENNLQNLKNLDLSLEDLDLLTKNLKEASNDFEVLNTLIEFFDSKLKTASNNTVNSFDSISSKIEETKLNIKSTEDYIKSVNDQIKNTAPGKFQAELIQEREAAKKALIEEKVALEDYKAQIKSVAKENVSLETQLRRVKDELIELELEGKRGSARWEELRDKAAQYNEVIRDTNQELNRASSHTSNLDHLLGAVSGLVGAFSAAEGAAALFGEQEEELEQTLIKLNGAIALLNGLQAVQIELAKKDTLAYKGLTLIQKQYSIAVDTSAKATSRLLAASKLLGVGLLIGALAAIVVYWEDIAKWMGIVNEETEEINTLNKETNSIYTEQVAKLKVMISAVERGSATLDQQKEAVKDYNKEFGNTLGAVKNYIELEERLITNGDKYIKYLQLKAKAEAATLLQINKIQEALKLRNEVEASPFDYVKSIFGDKTPNEYAKKENEEAAQIAEQAAERYRKIADEVKKESLELAKELGITGSESTKTLGDTVTKYESLLASLVDKGKQLQQQGIESNREREKAALNAQLEEEKAAYLKQIDNLNATEEQKLIIRKKYDEIYNKETGTAYEQLRKDTNEIDEKYNKQFEESRFNAISAINEVYNQEARTERIAIGRKWSKIREELGKQLAETEDYADKLDIKNKLKAITNIEQQEITNFDINTGLERIKREKEIADSILKIYQLNSREIINNEKLKSIQLLANEKDFLEKQLKVYRDSLKFEDQSLFEQLIADLQEVDSELELNNISAKLKQVFSPEVTTDILKIVEALKKVGIEIKDIGEATKKETFSKGLSKWTASIRSFSEQLGKALGLDGIKNKEALKAFSDSLTTSIETSYRALESSLQAEVEYHQERVNLINDTISEVENQVQKEKDLYDEGYANNYELRKKELQDLKDLKRQEEEELKKAQERKNKLAKAELLANAAQQTSNLITAGTEILKAYSGIPFAGILLAAGYIASMFALFAQFKSQAQQAQSFRQGLKEGALTLNGPRHEQGGFGLYDSKSGRKVAEFEDGEKLYVTNRRQQGRYSDILDALIADSQGRGNLEEFLKQKYGVPEVGKQTTQVVRHINRVTVQAAQAKEQASSKNDGVLKELKEFKDAFKSEFDGYKNERDNTTTSWETKEFYFVKKGQTIKKYPKKTTEE